MSRYVELDAVFDRLQGFGIQHLNTIMGELAALPYAEIRPARRGILPQAVEIGPIQLWFHAATQPPEKDGEYQVVLEDCNTATTLRYSRDRKIWYWENDGREYTDYAVRYWKPLSAPPEDVEL